MALKILFDVILWYASGMFWFMLVPLFLHILRSFVYVGTLKKWFIDTGHVLGQLSLASLVWPYWAYYFVIGLFSKESK